MVYCFFFIYCKNQLSLSHLLNTDLISFHLTAFFFYYIASLIYCDTGFQLYQKASCSIKQKNIIK